MAKILIVEDDTYISLMYQKIFEFNGMEVLIAKDGQEGIDMALAQLPSIILLDVMMPRVDGMTALKILKEDPKTAQIPVIILTNLSGTESEELMLQLGAEKFLIKGDHKPKEVFDLVNEVLSHSSQ